MLLGLIIPHFDIFIVIIFFWWIWLPLLLVLFIYFLILGLSVLRQKEKVISGIAITGLISILLIFTTPILSISIVDKYYKIKANNLINELESFKDKHGNYPESLIEINKSENVFNVKYYYIADKDNYMISYKRDGIVRVKYDNERRHWQNYGWKD